MRLQKMTLRNLKYLLPLIFLIFSMSEVYSSNSVSSVNAYQEGKNIVITYQLSERSNISFYVSTDGGKKYSSIKNISGDFGKNVSSGNKRIIWNVLEDYEKFNFSEVCFKITANEHNDHKFVDLGLPSGIKWATCNVGATKPEEDGDYFAWGETQPKDIYNWSTYKWCNGSGSTMTKYCTSSSYGTVDNKTTLELSDDAANANWGGDWRMPTIEEQEELLVECTWTWTTQNGVNGYKVTSPKNGNSIFLPLAGYREDSLFYIWRNGRYWSSSLSTSFLLRAYNVTFYSNGLGNDVFGDDVLRYLGQSVRPVLRE